MEGNMRPADVMFYMLSNNDAQPVVMYFDLDQPVNLGRMADAIRDAMERYPYFAVRLAVTAEGLWIEHNPEPVLLYHYGVDPAEGAVATTADA